MLINFNLPPTLKKRSAQLLTVLLLLVAIVFAVRNTVLQMVFKKVQARTLKSYSAELTVASVGFSGLDNIKIEGLTLKPVNADTLMHIDKALVNLSILDLLTFTLGFDEINIDGVTVNVWNLPGKNNITLTGTDTTGQPAAKRKPVTFRALAGGAKSKLLRLFNTAFYINNVQVIYHDTAATQVVYMPTFSYDKSMLTGTIINVPEHDTIFLMGEAVKKNIAYSFTASRSGKPGVYMPFFNKPYGLKCSFNTVKIDLNFDDNSNELTVNTNVQANGFRLSHWRIATEDVVVEQGGFNGIVHVRNDGIELDSATTVSLKSLKANLFASYTISPDTVFTLHVHMPETVSDTFFHSLPQGMFNTLKGISCTGSLEYNLFFSINTRNPDSLVFDSDMKRKSFTIRKYGAENYERMNGPFVYEAYDKNRFVRNIDVSPANPAFTQLSHISEYLVKSVLQSEDPSFMLHRGFLLEAFRESIVKNYKERRFARGGSTISMQLVKNVFLSRDKTISRKAEEALIVYLIENLHLVSKERMLEVYLNVIEWGPNIYGVGEASRFYFNKTPSALSLQESIFLAGIIPRPKAFKYQFDQEGNLKPYLAGYFRILTGRMAFKGWINPQDTTGLQPNVKLTGPALRMVVPVDTVIDEAGDDIIE